MRCARLAVLIVALAAMAAGQARADFIGDLKKALEIAAEQAKAREAEAEAGSKAGEGRAAASAEERRPAADASAGGQKKHRQKGKAGQ